MQQDSAKTKNAIVLAVFPLLLAGAVEIYLVEKMIFATSFRHLHHFYFFTVAILPAILLISGISLFIICRNEHKRRLGTRLSIGILALSAGLVCFGVYATLIEPQRLNIRELTLHSSKLKSPLKILHISDIQSAKVGFYEERVFKMMAELDPDIILFTGDLLQPLPPATMESEMPKITRLFESLHTRLGIFGAYGNVDDRLDPYKSGGKVAGILFLENRWETVDFQESRISVLGLAEDMADKPARTVRLFDEWGSKCGQETYTIAIGHSPDYAVALLDMPVDLCLAGHTHGGQVRIPFIGQVFAMTRFMPRSWALGYTNSGGTRLNVSGGIGCEHSGGLEAIRFNCPPEMTLITVLP